MSLKNNIIKVFSANILTLISSMIIGFIVPAILSIQSYAYLKTYTFYISYVTCLHFGFIDGIYMKYGGKELHKLNKNEIKSEKITLLIIELIITIIILILSIIRKDIILALFALSIIPINMSSFYKQLFQATGDFNSFTKISYIYTIIYFVLNVILVFIMKSNNYVLYCLVTLISNLIIYIILEFINYKTYKSSKFIYSKLILNNIKVGIYILIGNFAVIFFFAMDRWFVKLFYTVDDFAYYSFAISMLNIINTLITGISIVFYNYICKEKNNKKLIEFKRLLIIIGAGASLGYFVLDAIISIFIKKYIPALDIIAISFAGYPYMIIINALYINLYKMNKNKKIYLNTVIKMIAISLVYNIIAICIFKNLEAITFATTIAFITWYLYSIKHFNYLRCNKKEIIYLFTITISFLICAKLSCWLVGGIGYLIIFLVISMIIYKDDIIKIFKIILKRDI